MNYNNLSATRELRQQRAHIIAQAQHLLKKNDFSREDEEKCDAMMNECDRLKAQIDRTERVDLEERDLSQRITGMAGREDICVAQRQYATPSMQAFTNYLRGGMASLSIDDKSIMLRSFQADSGVPSIYATQGVGTGGAGGFTVPDEAMPAITEGVLSFGGLRKHATVLTTKSGADMPFPENDDTGNSGEIVSENASHSDQDTTFTQTVLNSYLYSSKMVKVSWQLMDDNSINLAEYVGRKLGERIGRIQASHFISGTGAGQPTGLVTAAPVGITAAATGVVTYDELVDLTASVDPAYLDLAKWLMNYSTLQEIRKLKDSQSRPLFGPDVAGGTPNSLLGFPVVIDQSMPNMATTTKSIAFGNLASYTIRDVIGVRVLRLEERFADNGQTGFMAFLRTDANLIDAGTDAVKVLQQA